MKASLRHQLIILAAIVLAYVNSLNNGFVWLDQAEILDKNLIITDLSSLWHMLLTDDNNYQGYHRPLYNLMHTLDYMMWGERAMGYHLSSLILHLANAILLYHIVAHIWTSKTTALVVALMFGLLPCHTAVVSLIHSKADLLACFFVLLPTYLYTKHNEATDTPPSTRQVMLWCLLLLLGLLAKELVIMLPIFIIALATIMHKKGVTLPRSIVLYPTITGLIFVIYRVGATDSISNPEALSLLDRVLSFIPVYVNYIVRTLTSYELTTNDAIRVWHSIPTGTYGVYVLVCSFLLGCQYYFSRKTVGIAAGFLWFNLFLAPVSQLIPILHFRADRYLYLPSIGFILAVVLIAVYYGKEKDWTRHKTLIIGGLAVYLLASSFRIRERNKDFNSDARLFGSLIASHPECREAQGFVGNDYLLQGDYTKALVHINKALESQTHYYSYVDIKSNLGNLGVIYMQQNKVEEALDIFSQLAASEKCSPVVYYNLGICHKKLGNYKAAIAPLEKYLAYRPHNIDALFNLGAIGYELGDRQLTQRYFTLYLQYNPGSEHRETIEQVLRELR